MKDLSQPPEALILTMPVAFFQDRMGDPYTWFYSKKRKEASSRPFGMWSKKDLIELYQSEFSKYFERVMRKPDWVWNFRKTTLPNQEVVWVYLIWGGKIQYRLNFVMYERGISKSFKDSTDEQNRSFVSANWIILSGPAVKAPYDIPMKGFQGHRYTQKIF